jgi:hypothetical protein
MIILKRISVLVLVDYIAIMQVHRLTSGHWSCGIQAIAWIKIQFSARGRSGNLGDLLAADKASHQQLSEAM